MNKYVEIPIDQIELDKSNPRIAISLQHMGKTSCKPFSLKRFL